MGRFLRIEVFPLPLGAIRKNSRIRLSRRFFDEITIEFLRFLFGTGSLAQLVERRKRSLPEDRSNAKVRHSVRGRTIMST